MSLKRINFIKRSSLVFALILASLFFNKAYAVCNIAKYVQADMMLDAEIAVPRNVARGTLLKTYTRENMTKGDVTDCRAGNGDFDYGRFIGFSTSPVSGMPDVYETGVPGIGFKVLTNVNDTYLPTKTSWEPISNTSEVLVAPLFARYHPYAMYQLQLIATGEPVGSGSMTKIAGIVAKVTFDNKTATALNITNMPSVNIRATGCYTSGSKVIDLGKISINETRGAPGSVYGEKDDYISFTCEAGIKVSATLNGNVDPEAGNQSVLALSDVADKATGLGVQFLTYQGTPIEAGVPFYIGTADETVMQHRGGIPFDFKVRYFQTRPAVTAGIANTTAVLNMTYQ